MLWEFSVVISMWVVMESESCSTPPLTDYNDFDGCAHIDKLESQLEIQYNNVKIQCDQHVKINDASKAPGVEIKNFKEGSTVKYHLLMVDPDAPSRGNPTHKYWFHWVKLDVSINGFQNSVNDNVYEGPSPPKDTGVHRYQFLLFKTVEEMTFQAPTNRGTFNVKKFAEDHNLCENLVATFQYLASHNDYLYEEPPKTTSSKPKKKKTQPNEANPTPSTKNGVNRKEAGTVFVVTMVLIAKLLPSFV